MQDLKDVTNTGHYETYRLTFQVIERGGVYTHLYRLTFQVIERGGAYTHLYRLTFQVIERGVHIHPSLQVNISG